MSNMFEFDLADVDDLLDGLTRLRLTEEDWERLGQATVARILQRTEEGRDQDGRRFAPYSAAYARRRAKGGRSASVVTLAYTGRMLGALTSTAIKDGARLTFVTREAARLAELHQNGAPRRGVSRPAGGGAGRAGGGLPARRFLGVGTETREGRALADLAAKMLAKRINESARAIGGV